MITTRKNSILFILILMLFAFSNMLAQSKKLKAQIEIKGIIYNELNKPVSGAIVNYDMGKEKVFTNSLGQFSLSTSKDDVIVVEKAGYNSMSEIASAVTIVNLTLEEAFSETVELPYNMVATTRDVTAPVTLITGEELSRYPSSNLLETLTGKIPSGLFLGNNYAPGTTNVTVNIRDFGYTVLVDGIQRSMNNLTTDEVESVTVLRGLSARAMYGYDARNGLIIVKTTRGTIGKRSVTASIEYGAKIVNDDFLPKWTNSYDYVNLYNEAALNDGTDANSLPYSDAVVEGYSKGNSLRYPDVDLYNEVLNNRMDYKRMNFQLSGGDKITQYFFNINYLGEGRGLLKQKAKTYDNLRLNSNVDVEITEDFKVSVDALAALEFTENPLDEGSLWKALGTYPANAYPIMYAPDTFAIHPSYPFNPVASFSNRDARNRIDRTGQVNLALDYDFRKLLDGLKANAYLTYDIFNQQTFARQDSYSFVTYRANWATDINGADSVMSYTPYGVESPSVGTSLSSDNYNVQLGAFFNLSYANDFGKSHIATNVNYFLQHRREKGVVQDYKRQNMSLTTNYSFDRKYYADIVFSYTGNSSLPKDNRFKLFPTLGLGWILSEEEFLKDVEVVDFLKLRTSYGTMGVYSGSGSFLYRSEWVSSGSQFFGSYTEGLTEGQKKVTLQQNGNLAIDWGTTSEFEIGMDALFLDERLSLQLDYYAMHTSGLILSAMTPDVLGYSNYYDNIGDNKYNGVDGAIRFADHLGDFFYSIGFNGGYNVSDVVKDNRPVYTHEWMNRIGNPTDAIYGFVSEGLFIDDADIASSPEQTFGTVLPGNIKYKDLDGSNTIEANLDNQMIGNYKPRFKYGMDLSLTYKGFDLYVLGYGVSHRDVDVSGNTYFHSDSKNKYSNYVMNNRWIAESPSTDALHPRLTTASFPNDNKTSTYWLRNAAFFKIKNVELAYTFSASISEKLLLNNLRVFVRGTNLLTFSEMKDLDPESLSMGVSQYPSMMAITGGVSVKF